MQNQLFILNCAVKVKMTWLFFIFAIGLIFYTFHSVFVNEMELDRIEIVNLTHSQGVYNFTQLKNYRLNQRTHALESDVDILVDLDENWEIEAHFYYSRFNNNHYTETSIHIQRALLCNVLEKYKQFITFDTTKNITNFPVPTFGRRICPIKAVTNI